MISYELLPCPFCGAEAKAVFSGSCNYVTCSKEDGCWCSLTCPTSTPEEAVRIWNRRTIDRHTCRNVSGGQDVFECSECRCRAELVTEVCNEHGDQFHTPLMPSFCPNCGSMVTDTLDASKVDGK